MRKALLSTVALTALLTFTAASAQERAQNNAREMSPSQSQTGARQTPARAAQQRQPGAERNGRGAGMAAEPRSQRQTVGQGETRQPAQQQQGQNEERRGSRQPAAANHGNSNREAQKPQERARGSAEPKSRNAHGAEPSRSERNARGAEPNGNRRNERSATSRSRAERNGASERRASERGNTGSRSAESNARSRHEGAQAGQRDHTRAAESTQSRRSNTRVSERDRTRIRESIGRLHVRPLTRVNFSVRVGVRVPGSISLYPLPEEIVAIYPQYRGYDFVLVRDRIAIIQPSTHEIVRLLPYAEEPRAASRGYSGSDRVRLSNQQRQVIRRTVTTRETIGEAPSEDITIGETLPDTVVVHEFPQTVYEDAPALRSYRYVVHDNDVYLVNPGDRRVIETIR